MSELVKKAGLTKGAFYHYFESKELLFRAAVESCVLPIMNPALDTKNNTLCQFYHDYIDYYFSSMETLKGVSPLRYHILLLDYAYHFPDAFHLVEKIQQPERSMWSEVIQNAKARREIRSEIEDDRIVDMFIFSSDGVGLHNMILQKIEEMKTRMLAMWDSLYDLLKKK
jgi:AcrR family transcriptional regulator